MAADNLVEFVVGKRIRNGPEVVDHVRVRFWIRVNANRPAALFQPQPTSRIFFEDEAAAAAICCGWLIFELAGSFLSWNAGSPSFYAALVSSTRPSTRPDSIIEASDAKSSA